MLPWEDTALSRFHWALVTVTELYLFVLENVVDRMRRQNTAEIFFFFFFLS